MVLRMLVLRRPTFLLFLLLLFHLLLLTPSRYPSRWLNCAVAAETTTIKAEAEAEAEVIEDIQLHHRNSNVATRVVGCSPDDAECIYKRYMLNHHSELTKMGRYGLFNGKNLIYCTSVECVKGFADSHSTCNNEIIYLMQISDLFNSFAVAYNLPWLQHLVGLNASVDQYFILVETGAVASTTSGEIFASFMAYMPRCTVFCVFSCNSGQMTMDIRTLAPIRSAYGHGRTVMMHLSNENPYPQYQNSSEDVASYCYGDPANFPSLYSNYALVVRPYYYKPLDEHSLYMPLGSREFDLLRHFAKPIVPSSQRNGRRCFFSGRFSYDIFRPHHYERQQLKEMLASYQQTIKTVTVQQNGGTGGELKSHITYEGNPICDIYMSTDEIVTSATFTYIHHTFDMLQTQFCLAPAGNSPETFRVYESFETGCIPLLVYPLQEMNYIRDKWNVEPSRHSSRSGRYPGPAFFRWAELPLFWMALDALERGIDPTLESITGELSVFINSHSATPVDLTAITSIKNKDKNKNRNNDNDESRDNFKSSSFGGSYPDWVILWLKHYKLSKSGGPSREIYNSYIDQLQRSVHDWYGDFLYQQSGRIVDGIYAAIYEN